jgi:hypothetical protein
MNSWKQLTFAAVLAAMAFVAGAGVTPPTAGREDAGALRPGDFLWQPEAAPEGPLLMVVSIVEQRAYLYRNGVRIAVSTVSTGKPGKETPAGVFTILQKHKEHYSNLYDSAPMPFMQRLTWSGVALHAGRVPGYPASHGCIRLPEEFARRLFGLASLGMTVLVADDSSPAPTLAHPGWLAPALAGEASPPAPADGFWTPELAPEGPITILLATTEHSVRVLRNGVEIGRSRFELEGAAPGGVQVLQLQAGLLPEESAYVPGRPRLNWRQLRLGGAPAPGQEAELYGRVRVPAQFAREVYELLQPGTTVVITEGAPQPSVDEQPLLDSAPP